LNRFWVARAGKYGERISWALENNLAAGGWNEVPDLTPFKSDKQALKDVVTQVYGGPKGRISTNTGQLWMFINGMQVGDIIVLPIRETSQLAFGRITEPYHYVASEPDVSKRHRLGVDWFRKDVPKSLVKQDLLYQLGSALTFFVVGNNDAPYRLEALMNGKPDPGARTKMSDAANSTADSVEDRTEDSDGVFNLEEVAQDVIARRLMEDFKGHELSELVEALLTAEGFVCRNSPPGADGGVDVLAGRGPLGMDSPKLVVQVKSQTSAVSDTVLQQLNGAIHRFQADQALLVTYGGVTGPAASYLATQYFNVRVWTISDILEQVYKHYPNLPGEVKAKLPLKSIWVPVSSTD
jgi:restriction system protein